MSTLAEFQTVNEWSAFRGFTNLLSKENRTWWGTHRWWINALLWSGILGGLVALIMFVVPTLAESSGDPNVAAAGGLLPFARQMGRTIFFEMGTMVLSIGVIVLSQDLIVDERQSGVLAWLLAKPVTRRAYFMAKLVAFIPVMLVLLILLPALLTDGLFFLRTGTWFPLLPFLSGLGLMSLHCLFYLTLTLMLGVFFSSRPPILGIALGVLLGGNFLTSIFRPLTYITPWILGKSASQIVAGQPLPPDLLWTPIAATLLFSLVFILLALGKFEKEVF